MWVRCCRWEAMQWIYLSRQLRMIAMLLPWQGEGGDGRDAQGVWGKRNLLSNCYQSGVILVYRLQDMAIYEGLSYNLGRRKDLSYWRYLDRERYLVPLFLPFLLYDSACLSSLCLMAQCLPRYFKILGCCQNQSCSQCLGTHNQAGTDHITITVNFFLCDRVCAFYCPSSALTTMGWWMEKVSWRVVVALHFSLGLALVIILPDLFLMDDVIGIIHALLEQMSHQLPVLACLNVEDQS